MKNAGKLSMDRQLQEQFTNVIKGLGFAAPRQGSVDEQLQGQFTKVIKGLGFNVAAGKQVATEEQPWIHTRLTGWVPCPEGMTPADFTPSRKLPLGWR